MDRKARTWYSVAATAIILITIGAVGVPGRANAGSTSTTSGAKSAAPEYQPFEPMAGMDRAGPPKSVIGVMGKMAFFVDAVEPGLPADTAGLKVGDLIVGFDGHGVNAIDDVTVPPWISAPGKSFKVRYIRIDKTTGEPSVHETTITSVPWQSPTPPSQFPSNGDSTLPGTTNCPTPSDKPSGDSVPQ